MRRISRLTGKPIKFKNTKQYEAHLQELREKGLLKRERSRRVQPTIRRDEHWKAVHNPLSLVPKRFTREELAKPENHTRWKFSIIHPTRGRPAPARQCMYMWMDQCSPHNELEYIMSLDLDDAPGYLPVAKELLGQTSLKFVINDNVSMVHALNTGAKYATGDVFIYVSDDFECFPNWDLAIQKAVEGHGDDWVLFVYDGIQKDTQTISILSRTYYKRFGYIYYPEYISMCADPDFTEVARRLHKDVNGMHLTFRHNHYIAGGLPYDDTYARQNSPEAWAKGTTIMERRVKENFGI